MINNRSSRKRSKIRVEPSDRILRSHKLPTNQLTAAFHNLNITDKSKNQPKNKTNFEKVHKPRVPKKSNCKMAVKKHALVHDNHNQLDLSSLAQYIQLMNKQPNYLPPPSELVKNCQDIVKCLARTSVNDEQFLNLLQSIEEFLLRVVNSVHPDVRHEIVTAILDKFYGFISDPQSDASPAASIVLIVLDESNNEAFLSCARWLVQQESNGPAGEGLRAALSCLYRWMYEWQSTSALGIWIMAYITALEENERFNILIEVSVDNIVRLFLAMAHPQGLKQSEADVIFHVLASLRESTEVLDRISGILGDVLVNLAADSGNWSRQLLQNVVDILTSMVDTLLATFKGKDQDIFKNKYSDVIACLDRHMVSHTSQFRQLPAWRARNLHLNNAQPHPPMRKVGLLNLGNTCYMNSVMQALLVTRQFSTHVVMKMNAVPYWSKMGILFANMMHSITATINPNEFFNLVRPPFFTWDHQHDSSEFLGYLFELLQSHEHGSDRNFDYKRTPVLTTTTRMRATGQHGHSGHPSGHPSGSSSEYDHPECSTNRRPVSPCPGSSAAGSSSGLKRCSMSPSYGPQKKRIRFNENAFLRRDSFIDSMFGGVLLTRVECTECHSSSLSRDVFRDLQLGFPDKPESWRHSVQNLLEYYCSKERLSGDNRYDCRDCGGLRDAYRSVLIETTPKHLILVLKNFKYEQKQRVQTKSMHSIYYNHSITLPAVRSQVEHASYCLYAAVVHAGTTLDSGHYYTLGKDDKQWYLYNDDVVSAVNESELNGLDRSSTPYILFYRRADVEEGVAPTIEDLPPSLQESVKANNKQYVEAVRERRVKCQ